MNLYIPNWDTQKKYTREKSNTAIQRCSALNFISRKSNNGKAAIFKNLEVSLTENSDVFRNVFFRYRIYSAFNFLNICAFVHSCK